MLLNFLIKSICMKMKKLSFSNLQINAKCDLIFRQFSKKIENHLKGNLGKFKLILLNFTFMIEF
jgi:hypothetical protein